MHPCVVAAHEMTALASTWSTVDGTLDNEHSNAIDFQERETATLTWDLREKLAAQIPYIDGQWPPPDTSIVVTLDTDDWRALAQVLQRSIDENADWADPEDTATQRAAVAKIERALEGDAS